MPSFAPNINSFNAGEWSPLTAGRVDIEKYPNSLRKCFNALPDIIGPVSKRPGTRYVSSTKDDGLVSLIPWEFSRDQSYLLEVGELYLRIWRNDGTQVESAPSTPVELVTPWTAAEAGEIQWAQSADVMYLAQSGSAPQILRRLSDTSWTIESYSAIGGPLLDENLDDSLTLTSTGLTGSVTITASSAVFDSLHVGSTWAIRSLVQGEYTQWSAGETGISQNTRRWSPSLESAGRVNVYEKLSAGNQTAGTRAPGHDSGTESDGVIDWTFVHSESGFFTVDSFTSDTEIEATVVSGQLPSAATTGTFRWSEDAWSDFRGFPRSVAFFERRLWWGHTDTQPQTIWASEVEIFDRFFLGTLDTSAITYTLATDRINPITFLSPGRVFVIGTGGGEFVAQGGNDQPITATNVSIKRQSEYGSFPQQMTRVSSVVLFVQRNRVNLRELTYNFNEDNYVADDLTTLAEHIGKLGINRTAFQQEPDRIVWTWGDAGELVGFTYEREQQVAGWHEHDVGGAVETLVISPSPDGNEDRVWMVVRRTIDGNEKRYIEYMTNQEANSFVDSHTQYVGPPISTVTGLDHLEGEEVYIVADGAVDSLATVTGGEVTLRDPETGNESGNIVVGLPYTMDIRPQLVEGGSANGVSQGKKKIVSSVVYRLDATGPGLWHGSREDNLTEIHFRDESMLMDTAVPLFTGDLGKKRLPGGHDDAGSIILQHRLPQACTVVAIYPKMQTNDDR